MSEHVLIACDYSAAFIQAVLGGEHGRAIQQALISLRSDDDPSQQLVVMALEKQLGRIRQTLSEDDRHSLRDFVIDALSTNRTLFFRINAMRDVPVADVDDPGYRASFLKKLCDLSLAGDIVIDKPLLSPQQKAQRFQSVSQEKAFLRCKLRAPLLKHVRAGLEGRLMHLLRSQCKEEPR